MGVFFVNLINGIIKALGSCLSWALGLLPASPFNYSGVGTQINEYLGSLAWVIPYPTMLAIFETWIVGMMAYYVISAALRWVKLIS